MSPQDRPLTATPGSDSSHGNEMTSSPQNGAHIPAGDAAHEPMMADTYSSLSGKGQADDNGQNNQGHADLGGDAGRRPQCEKQAENSKCQKRRNGVKENGGKDQGLKSTIFPWMKESRQNQKKKSIAAITPTGKN